jgi:L-amino acid N-acyltransferase YncA
MQIRTAIFSDLDAVSAIYNREVERATSTFDTEPRRGQGATDWFESHASDAYPILVAEENGEIVGWASLTPWSPRGAYARTVEGSLFVRDGHRGRGVGKALTCALIEHARRAGHGVLIARAETGNEPSRSLLLDSGFQSIGVMHRVGEKFGRLLDVELFELPLD